MYNSLEKIESEKNRGHPQGPKALLGFYETGFIFQEMNKIRILINYFIKILVKNT